MTNLAQRGLPDFEAVLKNMDLSVRVAWAEKFLKDTPADPLRNQPAIRGLENRLLDAHDFYLTLQGEVEAKKRAFDGAIAEAVSHGIEEEAAKAFMDGAIQNSLMLAILEASRAKGTLDALVKDVARLQDLTKKTEPVK